MSTAQPRSHDEPVRVGVQPALVVNEDDAAFEAGVEVRIADVAPRMRNATVSPSFMRLRARRMTRSSSAQLRGHVKMTVSLGAVHTERLVVPSSNEMPAGFSR